MIRMSWRNELSKEIEFRAVRSRGPGGQNVNRTSSAALLYWRPEDSSLFTVEEKSRLIRKLTSHLNAEGYVYLRCEEFRDLSQNKRRCQEKLIALIESALRKEKKRIATKPTAASKRKRLEEKGRRSETKKLRRKVFD